MVIKRSISPGFAGIDNPVYYLDKTLMLFGDAKSFVNDIVHELAGGGDSIIASERLASNIRKCVRGFYGKEEKQIRTRAGRSPMEGKVI